MIDGVGQGGPRNSRALLRNAIAALNCAGIADAHLDAELLLAEAAGLSRVQVLTSVHELDDEQAAHFRHMTEQRAARVPLAYVLGRREFYSIELKVDSSVLIPRPETETLVNAALDFIGVRQGVRILDIGTGSGAIALALAVHAPSSQIVATDISPAALAIARANAASLGVAERIDFIHADCWPPQGADAAFGKYDVIVSNPPYIAEAELDSLQPEVRLYEPRTALTPGPDGLSFYRRIATGLADHLAPKGVVMLELGYGQAQAAAEIFRHARMASVNVMDDLAGIPRVLRAQGPD